MSGQLYGPVALFSVKDPPPSYLLNRRLNETLIVSVFFSQYSCHVPAIKKHAGVDVQPHSLLILVIGETSGRFDVKAALLVDKSLPK